MATELIKDIPVERETPTKVTVYVTDDGYALERSDKQGKVFIYPSHTIQQFLAKVREIIEG